ncbi:HypC/HybG/HupF family hydrogenase formation chaperone [Arcanobacterium hippocoleae]
MCLCVPCEILAINTGIMPMGKISVNGEEQDICMAYLPEAQVGDYVMIQGGFAISLLSKEEAEKSFNTWQEMGVDAVRSIIG